MNQLLPNRKPEGTNIVSCIFLACTVLFLCGCQKTSLKPTAIGSNDACFYCKAPISDKAYAAEFITKTGFVRKFDDIGCLVANAQKVGKKNIEAFYVVDAGSKEAQFLSAGEAQFVRSDKIPTPRNGHIVAFKDPSQAKTVAARFQGQVIDKFDDLLK